MLRCPDLEPLSHVQQVLGSRITVIASALFTGMAASPDMTQPQPLHPADRHAALNAVVMQRVMEGFRVETQTEWQVVVAKPANVNHVVHVILSLLTCGLWLPIWLIVAMTAKSPRIILSVDPYGQVTSQWAAK